MENWLEEQNVYVWVAVYQMTEEYRMTLNFLLKNEITFFKIFNEG